MMTLLTSVLNKFSTLASPTSKKLISSIIEVKRINLAIQAGIFWLFARPTDQFNVTDTKTIGVGKAAADNVQFGDATKTFAVGKGVADNVQFGEVVASNINKPLAVDDTNILDQAVIGYAAPEAETINIQDQAVYTTQKNISDILNVTDDLDGVATIEDDQVAFVGKSLSDQINFGDLLVPVTQFVRTAADTTNITDQSILAYGLAPSDITNFSDLLVPVTQFVRTPTDTVNFSDLLVPVTQFVRAAADTTNFTDAGLVSVQSYTDPTYFSADYVGDSRTF